MGFRLVPNSVTLNDLERHNDRYLAFFSPNSVALGADYVKVVEDRPIQSYMGFQAFRTLTFSYRCVSYPIEASKPDPTLTPTLALTPNSNTNTHNPKIITNPNPINSRYLTLTLSQNAEYVMPGYEKVRVRNI